MAAHLPELVELLDTLGDRTQTDTLREFHNQPNVDSWTRVDVLSPLISLLTKGRSIFSVCTGFLCR